MVTADGLIDAHGRNAVRILTVGAPATAAIKKHADDAGVLFRGRTPYPSLYSGVVFTAASMR